MATSSIFASFNINDSATAEAFAAALDKSYKESGKKIMSPAPRFLTDEDELTEYFKNRTADK